ncbi:MAG: TonB-dependent receptor [Paludibacteraceae bacterium]|nr:TonB-dependent receptor [Paludibacteraceae bacterium]
MYKSFFKQTTFRFRRFSRKAYAAFASMHKQVSIGHVSRLIADKELLKAGKAVATTFMSVVASAVLYAEELPPEGTLDPTLLQLEEVSVTGQRSQFQSDQFRLVTNISSSEISLLPVHTASDLLKYIPGIDLRERGASGVQSDLTMRGGTGRQVKILLNGVDITDPQTDHYSMDLPVDAEMIERIEVLQGTNYALDAFSGAINIITKQASGHSDAARYDISGSLAAGEYGYVNPRLSALISRGEWYINAGASYNRSSGYMADTDYKIANAYVQTAWRGLSFQAGAQFKDAGANSFYTVKYPNQFDQTRTLITSLSYTHNWGGWNLQGNVYYRAHFDRFHTYRNGVDIEGNAAPEWYKGPNLTWTHTTGAHIQGGWNNDWTKTTAGIDLRDELIESTSLGDHNRINLRYFLEERLYWNILSVAAGASGTWNSQFGHDWALGVNLGVQPIKDLDIFLNFNRAIRIPTYTDLYYHTATQSADENTRPEKALQLELSLKYQWQHLYLNASGFYRWGRDIIDWVKDPSTEVTVWQSTNHSKVDAAGAEATIGVRGYEWLKKVELSYAFTNVSADAGDLLSLYALDYLRHKAALRIEHKIYKGFGATWCLRMEKREGEYTSMDGTVENYNPVVLLDGGVYWANQMLRVSIDARNMTNTKYVDIGGVVQPQHWVSAKVTFNLTNNKQN